MMELLQSLIIAGIVRGATLLFFLYRIGVVLNRKKNLDAYDVKYPIPGNLILGNQLLLTTVALDFLYHCYLLYLNQISP